MLWNEIWDFVIKNGFNFLFVLGFCLIIYILRRYVKFLYLFRYCRKLARIYNGILEKIHPLFLRIFIDSKEPDVKIRFADKELYVKFIRIKQKTTIRFIDANTIEKIRYRKAIVPNSNNKGLTPGSGYAIVFGQGSEVTPISSTAKINFNYKSDAIGLLLFTENPSGICVFNSSHKNYDIIGDGETAYSYHVGGRNFIKKWIERNT